MLNLKEIVFYGDDVLIYEFPEDIDIYYAKDPIDPIKNEKLAIKNAIENPIGSKKLEDLISHDSHIVICFDDIRVLILIM
jgi:nickel-dependent lactate racemase